MRPSLPVISDLGERARVKKGALQEVGQKVRLGSSTVREEVEGIGQSENKLGHGSVTGGSARHTRGPEFKPQNHVRCGGAQSGSKHSSEEVLGGRGSLPGRGSQAAEMGLPKSQPTQDHVQPLYMSRLSEDNRGVRDLL